MTAFLNWFFAYISAILQGLRQAALGLLAGVTAIFDLPAHLRQFSRYSQGFGVLDWILALLAALMVIAMWAVLLLYLVSAVLRAIRRHREAVRREELLQQVDELTRRLRHVTQENTDLVGRLTAQTAPAAPAPAPASPAPMPTVRFPRLCAIDRRYRDGMPPTADGTVNMQQLCEQFRCFAASQMGLYYNKDVICSFFAGLATSRLLILQGISGTGKTSLPYALGKFLSHDATVAPVQPAWSERADLLGYLNTFTHTFHETEVLCHLYEADYRDDVGLIVLDEMNIARIEYYFADLLSLLELPDPAARRLMLVSETAADDPVRLTNGDLRIPPNVWFVGTANHDESTKAISDKVYDRAVTLQLDAKGIPFDAPPTAPITLSYRALQRMFDEAVRTHPIGEQTLRAVELLDAYLTAHFGISFGNRTLRHLHTFVPVYVACGGEAHEAVDELLATKVLRRLDAAAQPPDRAALDALMHYLDGLFGAGRMHACHRQLRRCRMYI